MITKKEINILIDAKLTKQEKLYYKDYIKYMNENNFFEFVYYLNNKHLFFKKFH